MTIGGVTHPHKKASKSVQIIYLENKNARKASKLIQGRVNFEIAVLNDNVYVIGGTCFVKGVETTLASCEVFNLKTMFWRNSATLNIGR